MNLGTTAIYAFLTLALVGGVGGFLLAALIGWRSQWRLPTVLIAAILCSGGGAIATNCLFHRPLLCSWHQQQNLLMPRGVPCLSYDATPQTLEASYTMTQEQFLTWVQHHPLKLRPTTDVHFYRDGTLVQRFPGLKFASTPADLHDAQLRAYHVGTTACISYNAW